MLRTVLQLVQVAMGYGDKAAAYRAALSYVSMYVCMYVYVWVTECMYVYGR